MNGGWESQRSTVRTLALVALVALAAGWSGAARAADGVLEINQTCVASGCVPGDGGGYPVSTQANQSYVLTSNLAVADADTTAITLAAGATLDLNGFSITGPAVCTGTPPSCVGLGAGRGVATTGPGATIRNGRITGMGGDGIAGYSAGRVERMVIEANGDEGIDATPDAAGWSITDCRILRNKDIGINLSAGTQSGVVSRNIIWGNGGAGIYGAQLAITENAIYDNGGLGISGNAQVAPAYNSIYRNNGGAQTQTGGFLIQTGPNSCQNGACP